MSPRIILLALAAACSPATAPPPSRASTNPWADCYAGFAQTGNPRGDLIRLSRGCGKPLGMRPLTPVVVGQQKARSGADRFTFPVPEPGRCYRVFAAGSSTIEDLDLLLRGPDGELLVGDLTHDAWPVLPPAEPLCFAHPGLYMLEVSVFRGSGTYAVQVWGN